jgi:hypothetical protein
MEILSSAMIIAPRRSSKALVWWSLLPIGFLCTPERYLWYEAAHLLRALTPLDINSDDESPSTISLDALRDSNKTEAEKIAREKKNK